MVRKHIFTLLILFSLSIGQLIGQTPITISKSEQIRIINSKEYYVHVVQKDHTLYSISKAYGLSMDEIKFENPSSRNGLSIDQELYIPVKSRDAIVRESYQNGNYDFFYHIVKKGEDFDRIASIYSVQQTSLKTLNSKLSEPLKTGQYLKIPIETKAEIIDRSATDNPMPALTPQEKPEPKQVVYTAQQGDNLYLLALKFHVSIDEIKQLNPGLKEYFYVGKEIRIPAPKNKQNFINHRVLKKERLSNIAKYYNLSYSSVLQMNPRTRNRASVGQIIKIPAPYKIELEPQAEVEIPKEIEVEIPINRDSMRCFSDESNQLKRYKVALMIPLYLEEIDSVSFNPDRPISEQIEINSLRYLNFYYGSLMAIDSLKKQGLKIDLHVYDVDADMSKAIKVINEYELREMDLIIGPFFYSAFQTVAAFAKNYRIPIVNPFSGRSEVVDFNPNVFKVQPSNRYQIEDVQKLVAQYHKNSKIFMVNHHTNLMNDPLNEYANKLKDVIDTEFKVPNLDIYNLEVEKAAADTALVSAVLYNESVTDSALMKPVMHSNITIEGKALLVDSIKYNMFDTTLFENEVISIYFDVDSLNPFKNQASVFRNNVVIVNSDDNVFALNVLTELNILRDTFPISVIGIPNWEIFENMDNRIYENLNLYFLSSAFVDYNDSDVKAFVSKYRQTFLSEPDNLAFTGFDISWYFFKCADEFWIRFRRMPPILSTQAYPPRN